MDRKRVTRWAAPVAFLAAITIGALVVRAGFESGHHRATQSSTTVTTTTSKKHRRHTTQPAVKMYTVQTGDTLAAIAVKNGTTVTRLIQLNPGINPTALRVGQRIRVQ